MTNFGFSGSQWGIYANMTCINLLNAPPTTTLSISGPTLGGIDACGAGSGTGSGSITLGGQNPKVFFQAVAVNTPTGMTFTVVSALFSGHGEVVYLEFKNNDQCVSPPLGGDGTVSFSFAGATVS